jgi:sporulation protein YlmC with PRC-barrel domain
MATLTGDAGALGGPSAEDTSTHASAATTCDAFPHIPRVRTRNSQIARSNVMTTSSGHTSAIRVSKVLGTKVQNPAGQKIGQVEDVILDKESNHIMFAVLSFGGFLGVGEKYYPVPWSSLDYDENQSSYVVGYTKEQLQGAPAGSVEELTQNDGLNFRDRTYDYYKAEHYW